MMRDWQRTFCSEFLTDRRVGVSEVLVLPKYMGWSLLRRTVLPHASARSKVASEDHGAHVTLRFHFGDLWD